MPDLGYAFPTLVSLIESIPENLRGSHNHNYKVTYTTFCVHLKESVIAHRYFSDYREAQDFFRRIRREAVA